MINYSTQILAERKKTPNALFTASEKLDMRQQFEANEGNADKVLAVKYQQQYDRAMAAYKVAIEARDAQRKLDEIKFYEEQKEFSKLIDMTDKGMLFRVWQGIKKSDLKTAKDKREMASLCEGGYVCKPYKRGGFYNTTSKGDKAIKLTGKYEPDYYREKYIAKPYLKPVDKEGYTVVYHPTYGTEYILTRETFDYYITGASGNIKFNQPVPKYVRRSRKTADIKGLLKVAEKHPETLQMELTV